MIRPNLLLGLFAFFASADSGSCGIITQWTFETNPPADLDNSTSISGIAADTGTGLASGLHASGATDWSTPLGNGSANSLSANNWLINDYFQFSSSTSGFNNIMLNWSQTSSATGPRDFKLAYQINGGAFSDFQSYSVSANSGTWSAGTPINTDVRAFDLSSVLGLNNATTVSFRLIDTSTVSANGATVSAVGTDRVDNFTINGTLTAVPEPASLAFLSSLILAGAIRARCRKKRSSVEHVCA